MAIVREEKMHMELGYKYIPGSDLTHVSPQHPHSYPRTFPPSLNVKYNGNTLWLADPLHWFLGLWSSRYFSGKGQVKSSLKS